MKTIKFFALTTLFSLIIVLLSYCNNHKDITDPENPNKKQEIFPTGKNENYEKTGKLSEGQVDSAAMATSTVAPR